ncbi:hypothetical protein [Paractinoplanes toevensis]|uniref:hypothetical protein n=1 Tax=Paractinoplanes toevensis TaxID=571911 RepID=UPI001BB429AE|nr:hypothetical protein [Actinoplanes toevensis]
MLPEPVPTGLASRFERQDSRAQHAAVPVHRWIRSPGSGPVPHDHGLGVLGNGSLISPAEWRRFAGDTQILPAVPGASGRVLGRAQRPFTDAVRRADPP